MKYGINVVFETIFNTYCFLSAIVNVEGVKTTLIVGGAKHILSSISKIIEEAVLCNFFNGEYIKFIFIYLFISIVFFTGFSK